MCVFVFQRVHRASMGWTVRRSVCVSTAAPAITSTEPVPALRAGPVRSAIRVSDEPSVEVDAASRASFAALTIGAQSSGFLLREAHQSLSRHRVHTAVAFSPPLLAACPSGSYGKGCNQTCSCHNDGSCHPASGLCACTAGWTGPNCTEGWWTLDKGG